MTVSVTPQAQYSWTGITSAGTPTVSAYSNGSNTKTGLQPADVAAFIGIPLNFGGPNGTPIPNATILNYIRWAEDSIETDTGLLLCVAWIAAPAEITPANAQAAGLPNAQVQGVDYDLSEPGYDFFFRRFIQEGWGYVSLRYKPLRIIGPSALNFTAIKNLAYLYPLLNQFFAIPTTWMVEDLDSSLLRIVPAVNTQLLPLFAVQLNLLGFSQNIPQAMHMQYMAGLTPTDYSTRWAFVKQYVLAKVAVNILTSMQMAVNYGATELTAHVDGLRQTTKFNPKGPYAGFIEQFGKMERDLYARTMNQVAGPIIGEI